MDAFIGGHLGRRCLFVVIGRARLGLLSKSEDEYGAEHAAEEGQAAGEEIGGAALLRVLAEQGDPVLLVAGFCGGEAEQDLAVLALAAFGEVAIHALLEPFIGEVALPAANCPSVGGGGRSPSGGVMGRHWSKSNPVVWFRHGVGER